MHLHLQDAAIKHALAYLIPPALVALILIRWRRGNLAFAVIALPGTVSHELAHWCIGFISGARPTGFSVWPRREPDGSYVLGMVVFRNLRWWNAAPASLAPLTGYALAPTVAWLRMRSAQSLAFSDVVTWFVLGQILAAAWPSTVDWRLSLRSWPAAVAVGCGILVWHLIY